MTLTHFRPARSDGPVTAQQLHAADLALFHLNGRYSLYRSRPPGAGLVVKSARTNPPDPGAIASLRHEYELLHNLDLPGIVQVLGLVQTDDALALVMADGGQLNLAARIKDGPLSIDAFWDTALQLAQAVATLHQAGIIHRNLQPANVAWDAATQQATLVDFGIAITLSRLAVDRASPAQLEGTLAYMSPEQTGRTGHAVDSRSDLYALGATFHELLAGAPPFTASDPIELIHAHLARLPRALDAIDPAIPPVLAGIVLKLLEKEPGQRYLTAEALLADLTAASVAWRATGHIAPFALAQYDVPRQLSIPGKLHGRSVESAALEVAFERARRTRRELILVAGAPGIGKSALVRQLEESVAARRGYFLAGKFDQLQRSVPYEGLVQAFRMLVRQLLTEPDAALASWRARIQAAVAPNGQILIDIIPEIESIVGPQSALAELGPVESKNRFNQAFTSFLNVFAAAGHPLVLFLDDLQWVDAASLQLLQAWVADSATANLLVVGAYRDDEVGLAHPLTRALAALRKTGAPVSEIALAPLGQAPIAALLADALARDIDDCQPLAALILAKTAGNPFFIRRLLQALHGAGLIAFDARTRAWVWDMEQVASAPVSDNVLALMVQAIERLPDATRQLIQTAACIGHRFDLGLLAEVTGHARSAAMNQLWPALQDGLLLPLREAYKAPRQTGPLDQDLADMPVAIQFVHDRVQQAAYTLLTDERRGALHLAIGRSLLQRAATDQQEVVLFDVVHHMNRGAALMTDPDEQLALAQLNLAAGRKAKAAAAYQAAFDYLEHGQRLLPPDAWTALPRISFEMQRELAECAYLTGRHAQAEQALDTALQHAPGKAARVDLYSLRVLAATVAGDWAGALRWGREGLAVFDHAWPLEGLAEAIDAEALAVIANSSAMSMQDLIDQPAVQDDDIQACMKLLSILSPPAYFSGSSVLAFLIARSANLSLLHGPSVYSAYAYVFYGAINNARTGAFDVGYAFGQAALALARRFNNRAEESRTLEVFGLVVQPWRAPLRASLPLMQEGHRAGVESGELAYAAFNLCGLLINGLPAGVPLPDLLADAAISIDFATRHQNRTGVDISLPFRQFARALMGATSAPGSFDDGEFDAARYLEGAAGNQTATGHYWVLRQQVAYLFGDLATAQQCAHAAASCIEAGILGMVTVAEHAFHAALTLAAVAPAQLDAIAVLHRQLAAWAASCPDNFRHMQLLVEAELARLRGEPWEAMTLYGQAIDAAKAAGMVQDAALANALAGRHFIAQRQPRLAAVYLQAALDGYHAWGATGLAAALAGTQFDGVTLVAPLAASVDPAPAAALALDALGLIKASQAIAAQTVPEELFARILQIVVEVAGAQTCVLLLGDAAALHVRGRISYDAGADAVALEETALDDCAWLPRSVIRYVARMREPLVLDDAASAGPFSADPEVRTLGLRSVLCVPIKKQVQVVGMLYLENNAMASAFTVARLEVVQALASQAAISLENSALLADRARAEQELRQLATDLSNENRRKTEFLATLAHELRNPLAPIRTGLDLLRLAGATPVATNKIHEMMGRQLNQMVHLIDDLLDIARINSGKVALKRERVELRDAIASAVEATLPAIKACGHSLDIAIPDGPLVLDADPVRLAQVLSNLLTNAAKYTPRGGRIAVQVHSDGEGVDIAIVDSGVGIPAEALPDVFNMFSQVSRNMGRSQGGLGIGLSLVRSLVQMHGGVVDAASGGEGAGSTFTVHLPLADTARGGPAPAGPAADPSPASGRRLQVLVADDNVDAARMMQALLEACGHDVELAHDGLDAVARAAARSFDLAILDIGMPGLNGYEVARAIRAMPGNDAIFLAALTGWGAEDDRSRSTHAGFNAHLTKPAGMADINNLLAAALAR